MISEVQTQLERLRELRGHVLQTLEGLDADALNWKPLPTETNSVFVLTTHLLGAERHWLHEVVGQRKIERDRDAEFRARGETSAALRAAYAAVARESEEILARLDASDMDVLREAGHYSSRTVRWSILHMIEHYCEHLAQMRLTRQLWENQVKSKKAKGKRQKAKRKRQNVKRKT